MSFLVFLLIIIATIGIYVFYNYRKQNKISTFISSEQFKEGCRKAQIIDLREYNDFKAGHILGARNMPLSTFKHAKSGLRKDTPIYLYCQNQSRSARAASILYKDGYRNIHQLAGGYKQWDGKIKK